MPPVAAAAVTGAAALGGGIIASKSANKANKTQADSAAAALAYQKEQDAKAEAQYKEQQALLKAQYDEDMRRRAPYRATAEGLLRQNGARLGVPVAASAPARAMPAGWTPGAQATTTNLAPRTLSQYAGLAPTFSPEEEPETLDSINSKLSNWGSARRAY